MKKRTKLTLGSCKYYSPNESKKTGAPATLQPGQTVENLKYLETVEATKSLYKGRYNHKFLEGSEAVIFNGSSMLDRLVMEMLQPGDIVDITYVGQEACPFGQFKGRPTHVYEVFKVEEDAAEDTEETVDTDETF